MPDKSNNVVFILSLLMTFRFRMIQVNDAKSNIRITKNPNARRISLNEIEPRYKKTSSLKIRSPIIMKMVKQADSQDSLLTKLLSGFITSGFKVNTSILHLSTVNNRSVDFLNLCKDLFLNLLMRKKTIF